MAPDKAAATFGDAAAEALPVIPVLAVQVSTSGPAVGTTSRNTGRLRAACKGHFCNPHGRDLGDETFNGDDLLARRRSDGGFKMAEATRFEAGHGT